MATHRHRRVFVYLPPLDPDLRQSVNFKWSKLQDIFAMPGMDAGTIRKLISAQKNADERAHLSHRFGIYLRACDKAR